MMLANRGWWGGDPVAVLRAPADAVVLSLQYVGFLNDYEIEMLNINRPESS